MNLQQIIKDQCKEVREDWKCTCDDCGHINDVYDMDDLCDLIEETAETVLSAVREMVKIRLNARKADFHVSSAEIRTLDNLLTQLTNQE